MLHTIAPSNLSCGCLPGHSWGPEPEAVHQRAHPDLCKACRGSGKGSWLGLIWKDKVCVPHYKTEFSFPWQRSANHHQKIWELWTHPENSSLKLSFHAINYSFVIVADSHVLETKPLTRGSRTVEGNISEATASVVKVSFRRINMSFVS